MPALLLAMLASLGVPGAEPDSAPLKGQCQYSEEVIRRREDTVLIQCDALAISKLGAVTTLDFGRRSWGSGVRFSGEMSGNRMRVSRLRLRGRGALDATGTCEAFYTAERISVVSCLARAGSRNYAANFVPSRI